MFRDDAQIARACKVLCDTLQLGHLWGEGGPTLRALRLARGSTLSSGERALLRASLTIWNGYKNKTTLNELQSLCGPPARALWSLLLAVDASYPAIDDWIDWQEQKNK